MQAKFRDLSESIQGPKGTGAASSGLPDLFAAFEQNLSLGNVASGPASTSDVPSARGVSPAAEGSEALAVFSFAFGGNTPSASTMPKVETVVPPRKPKAAAGKTDTEAPAQAAGAPQKKKPGRPPRDLYKTCADLIQRFQQSERTDARYWGEESTTCLRNAKQLHKDVATKLNREGDEGEYERMERVRKGVDAIKVVVKFVSASGWDSDGLADCVDEQQRFLSMKPEVYGAPIKIIKGQCCSMKT